MARRVPEEELPEVTGAGIMAATFSYGYGSIAMKIPFLGG